MYLCMQCEVVVAIDEACKIYNETMPSVDRSEQRLREVISKKYTKIIRSIKTKEFEKLLAVASPGNGMEFLEEIYFNFNFNLFIMIFAYLISYMFDYYIHKCLQF